MLEIISSQMMEGKTNFCLSSKTMIKLAKSVQAFSKPCNKITNYKNQCENQTKKNPQKQRKRKFYFHKSALWYHHFSAYSSSTYLNSYLENSSFSLRFQRSLLVAMENNVNIVLKKLKWCVFNLSDVFLKKAAQRSDLILSV